MFGFQRLCPRCRKVCAAFAIACAACGAFVVTSVGPRLRVTLFTAPNGLSDEAHTHEPEHVPPARTRSAAVQTSTIAFGTPTTLFWRVPGLDPPST